MASEAPVKLDGWGLLRMVIIAVGSAISGQKEGEALAEGDIEAIAGAVVTLAMIGWGIYVRWNARMVPTEVAVRPNIPVQSSATGRIVTGPGARLT
jgi:hypothetical protein